jgi:hypothetical protein
MRQIVHRADIRELICEEPRQHPSIEGCSYRAHEMHPAHRFSSPIFYAKTDHSYASYGVLRPIYSRVKFNSYTSERVLMPRQILYCVCNKIKVNNMSSNPSCPPDIDVLGIEVAPN